MFKEQRHNGKNIFFSGSAALLFIWSLFKSITHSIVLCGEKNSKCGIVFSDRHKMISIDICNIFSFHICFFLELSEDYDLVTRLQKFIMV